MIDEHPNAHEEFKLSLAAFVEAIRLIASEPEKQAEIMGDFNVAWELKNDADAGSYLVSMPGNTLSIQQTSEIQSFLTKLSKVPRAVLVGASNRDANLLALQSDSWRSLRPEAARLLEILERRAEER